MIDPQTCVERILLNEPSELAVPVVGLLNWMAEQAPELKTNSEYLKALGVAQAILDYDQHAREADADDQIHHVPVCHSSTASN